MWLKLLEDFLVFNYKICLPLVVDICMQHQHWWCHTHKDQDLKEAWHFYTIHHTESDSLCSKFDNMEVQVLLRNLIVAQPVTKYLFSFSCFTLLKLIKLIYKINNQGVYNLIFINSLTYSWKNLISTTDSFYEKQT